MERSKSSGMARKSDPGPGAERGFTLLEVLVALIIIGLGMMAVFGQLNQMLTTVARLRDKTFATWIAVDRITEMQAIGEFPRIGERSDDLEMARSEWAYTIKISAIPNMDIRRVDVSVSFVDTPKDILAEVAGFIRPEQGPAAGNSPDQTAGAPNDPPGATSTGTGFGRGWGPLDPNADYSAGATR